MATDVEFTVRLTFLQSFVPCVGVDQAEQKRKISQYLRNECSIKFSTFAQSGYLRPFPPPKENSLAASVSWVTTICSLVLNDQTDLKNQVIKSQALAIWWFQNFLIGSRPSEHVVEYLQELRSAKRTPLWRGWSAREEAQCMDSACDFARGLAQLFTKPPAFPVAEEFIREVDTIQSALSSTFGFEAVKSAPPATNPAFAL